MRSPADIIRQLMLDLGLGSADASWPIYVGLLPDEEDEAICVYDTAGRLDGRLLQTGEQIQHRGIQIRVKGKDYLETFSKVESIANTLDAQAGNSVAILPAEVYVIHNISRTGAIVPLGIEEVDGRRCHHFTLNAVVTLT